MAGGVALALPAPAEPPDVHSGRRAEHLPCSELLSHSRVSVVPPLAVHPKVCQRQRAPPRQPGWPNAGCSGSVHIADEGKPVQHDARREFRRQGRFDPKP